MKIRKEDALRYHIRSPFGKIEVVPTKPVSTQRDLSLAYSPGVAYPCLEIAENPEKVYDYTARGNLVAVLSNGTAVLGLGNIGPEASKPVMEGKGVLFKKFAGIDVFDIEVNADTVEDFVKVAKALEPTFGGINLEDIKAPEAFEIESRLREELNIPIMHDDQHGTAIISAAALLNALIVAEKEISEVRIIVSGAGASALSCASLYLALGAKKENIFMYDSKGLLRTEREGLDKYKTRFAQEGPDISFEDSFEGADVFLGLSKGGLVKGEMIAKMAPRPIVLALANPDPEILPEEAQAAREDAIIATGRSDYPNQVNNVLGFPYIFRGALDVRATEINEEMKVAATRAIAELAKEPVPESVNLAYSSEKSLNFGPDYLIPKPIDPRLITRISTAVAKAAMDSGVAKHPIADFGAYHIELQRRVGLYEGLTRSLIQQACKRPQKVVFADADNHKVLKAAQIVSEEGIAKPILLGNKEVIQRITEEYHLDLGNIPIIDPREEDEKRREFGKWLHEKRKRKGVTLHDAIKLMRLRNYFGSMMVETGEADAFISGLTKNYPESLRPALQVIGKADDTPVIAGMHILKTKKGYQFLGDTTINKNPDAETLVGITRLVYRAVRFFNVDPKIALLSYSNFGSNIDDQTSKIIKATKVLQEKYPDRIVDGDVQANVALRPDILEENYNFSRLSESGPANTFIFPNLMAGNIAYKLMGELGGAEIIGPILLGMKKPVHILQLGSSVREIVNMVAIASVDAQRRSGIKV